MASAPLLLRFLCVLFREDRDKPVNHLMRRSDLFAESIHLLLSGIWKDPSKQRTVESVKSRIRDASELAYRLFAKEKELFSWDELADSIQEGRLQSPGSLQPSLGDKIIELNEQGLLVKSDAGPNPKYSFHHLSVQEYLAAYYLANRVNREGWDRAAVSTPNGSELIALLLDRKAWLPSWQDVISLIASQLTDPFPLLALLRDKAKDDIFHHRLALAAICLAEIKADILDGSPAIRDEIATAVFNVWWQHTLNDIVEAVPHLTRALRCLGHTKGMIDNSSPPEWIRRKMAEAAERVRTATIATLHSLTSSWEPWSELVGNLETIRDQEWRIRNAAVNALALLCSNAAVPEPLIQLTELIQDRKWIDSQTTIKFVCLIAGTKLIHQLGKRALVMSFDERLPGTALKPMRFLARLGNLILDQDRNALDLAGKGLARLGFAAARHEILARLCVMLCDRTENVQRAAAEAVRGLGDTAATPQILTQLAKLLRVENESTHTEGRATKVLINQFDILMHQIETCETNDVRNAAAIVLRTFANGPYALKLLSSQVLLKYAGFQVTDVRNAAALAASEVVRGLECATHGSQEILSHLLYLFGHMDEDVRKAASHVVRDLGNAVTVSPEILARFSLLVGQTEEGGKRHLRDAVDGLRHAGTDAAQILVYLLHLIGYVDRNDRKSAAQVVRDLGHTVLFSSDILSALSYLVGHMDESVSNAAANVIRGFGCAAEASLDRRAQLATNLKDMANGASLLHHSSVLHIRVASIWGVHCFYLAGAPAEVMFPVIDLLLDDEEEVRKAASNALRRLGDSAVPPEIQARLTEVLCDRTIERPATVVEVVQELGSIAATSGILARLAELLREKDDRVRTAAVYAVGSLGSAAAKPEILMHLAEMLHDKSANVRYAAVVAMRSLGKAIVAPNVLSRLTELLCDDDKSVRIAAADAIRISPPNREILARLEELLREKDDRVRTAAAYAVGSLGSAAAKPEILMHLAGLLSDEEQFVREAAANAMMNLMASGTRVFEETREDSRGLWGMICTLLSDMMRQVSGKRRSKWKRHCVQELSQCSNVKPVPSLTPEN